MAASKLFQSAKPKLASRRHFASLSIALSAVSAACSDHAAHLVPTFLHAHQPGMQGIDLQHLQMTLSAAFPTHHQAASCVIQHPHALSSCPFPTWKSHFCFCRARSKLFRPHPLMYASASCNPAGGVHAHEPLHPLHPPSISSARILPILLSILRARKGLGLKGFLPFCEYNRFCTFSHSQL
jgi:hypothetical protein